VKLFPKEIEIRLEVGRLVKLSGQQDQQSSAKLACSFLTHKWEAT
jgi:hypothetical protein